jgi:hypothetical protein
MLSIIFFRFVIFCKTRWIGNNFHYYFLKLYVINRLDLKFKRKTTNCKTPRSYMQSTNKVFFFFFSKQILLPIFCSTLNNKFMKGRNKVIESLPLIPILLLMSSQCQYIFINQASESWRGLLAQKSIMPFAIDVLTLHPLLQFASWHHQAFVCCQIFVCHRF